MHGITDSCYLANMWRPGVVVVGMDASVDPLDDLPDPADVPV